MQRQRYKESYELHSRLLSSIEKFLISRDSFNLLGIWQDKESLRYAEVKRPHNRFANIPKLYLDGTANEDVIKRVLGNIKYHHIKVKPSNDVNIYMLGDKTLTKKFLSKEEGYKETVSFIKNKILSKKYQKVGLLTYKSIQYSDSYFAERLANDLGISLYNHFGALRGIDAFDDVDLLLIVGRHALRPEDAESFSSAIFGYQPTKTLVYQEKRVRKKCNEVWTLINQISLDPAYHAITQHFSKSETKQAIGRGRAIHGKPKDIYYLSNEILGDDIVVTDFIYFNEPRVYVTSDTINNIIEKGIVLVKPIILTSMGANQNDVKNHMDRIYEELFNHGIHRISCNVKDNKDRQQTCNFLCASGHTIHIGDTIYGKKITSIIS
jgi:hypothetical protein